MANNDSVIKLERSLLGMILVEKGSINRIRGFLTPEDFYDKNNRTLFKAIIDANNGGFEIEINTIIIQLQKSGVFEQIGGDKFLTDLQSEHTFISNATKFAREIVEKSRLRQVKKLLTNLSTQANKEGATADDILENVEQSIISITRDTEAKDFRSVNEVADDSLQAIQKRATNQGVSGLVTDFPSLDDITSGLQKGDLMIIAARPSMGKTAFALNLVQNIAKHHTVAIFSLEMPARQLVDRLLASQAYIESNKLRDSHRLTASEWTKLDLACSRVKRLKLFIDDTPGLKLADLIWKSRRLKKNEGVDAIFIDYLQLLTVGKKYSQNRQNEVSLISRSLKQLARELDIPIIALSQLSRGVEMRENKRPMMSDIRESGAIEQDADIITFLYRPGYYNKDEIADPRKQLAELNIAKHRNGSLGTIKFMFDPSISLFSDDPKRNK